MSIKSALYDYLCEQAKYNDPICVSGPELAQSISQRMYPRSPMSGSTLRLLRELSREGKIIYANTDRRRSQYKIMVFGGDKQMKLL